MFYDAGFNDALEHLDLSWNHIRRKGAIEIANGLRVRLSKPQRQERTQMMNAELGPVSYN